MTFPFDGNCIHPRVKKNGFCLACHEYIPIMYNQGGNMIIEILHSDDKELYYVENDDCFKANKRKQIAFSAIETALLYIQSLVVMEFCHQEEDQMKVASFKNLDRRIKQAKEAIAEKEEI